MRNDSRRTPGLASLDNPNALYKYFNSQSSTISSMSSRWPSDTLSADTIGNAIENPKNLTISNPLPCCSTFSVSSSATTTTPKAGSMASDSSSTPQEFTRSKSRSLMMDRGDFFKKLNHFREKEGKSSKKSRKISTEAIATEPVTDTRSSATSAKIASSPDADPFFARQEQHWTDRIEHHVQDHAHGSQNDAPIHADEDHRSSDDDEPLPATPTRVTSALGHQNTDDISYAESPSYSLGNILVRQDPGSIPTSSAPLQSPLNYRPVTPTRITSGLENPNPDDISYAESPSYSLGNIFSRQDTGSIPTTSAPLQPSLNHIHSPTSVPFETSPSYVCQPNEQRLTPLNFYHAKAIGSLDDSNLESTIEVHEESSNHLLNPPSSTQHANKPSAEATNTDGQCRNGSAAHIGAENTTMAFTNPFTTPIHSPKLNHKESGYQSTHSKVLVQTPPEPAITTFRPAFPEELLPHPVSYSRGGNRFKTTAQRQQALLERERFRQAQLHTPNYPHLMPRALPRSQTKRGGFWTRSMGLNLCGYILLVIAQCSFGSCIAAGSYIFAMQKHNITLKGNAIGSSLWFWLVTSMVLLVFSFGTMILMYLYRHVDANRGSGGFRARLGMNEIIEDDAERGHSDHQETFEMNSGRWTSPRNLFAATSRMMRLTPTDRLDEASHQVPPYARNNADTHHQLRCYKQRAAVSPITPTPGAVSQPTHGGVVLKQPSDAPEEIHNTSKFADVPSLRINLSQPVGLSGSPVRSRPDMPTAERAPTQAPTQAPNNAQSDRIGTSCPQQTTGVSHTRNPTASSPRSTRHRDLALDSLNGLTPRVDRKGNKITEQFGGFLPKVGSQRVNSESSIYSSNELNIYGPPATIIRPAPPPPQPTRPSPQPLPRTTASNDLQHYQEANSLNPSSPSANSSSVFDTSSPLETLEQDLTDLSHQFNLELPHPRRPSTSSRSPEAKANADILRSATLKRKHLKTLQALTGSAEGDETTSGQPTTVQGERADSKVDLVKEDTAPKGDTGNAVLNVRGAAATAKHENEHLVTDGSEISPLTFYNGSAKGKSRML